jgi:hypothetical protein
VSNNEGNPFLPGAVQDGSSSPSLDDVLAYVSRATALSIRVCLPAKVVKVRGPQHVDLKPLIRQQVYGTPADYPIIAGALVSMPVGGSYALTVPLAIGDTGLLLCCDRSLDAYTGSNGVTPVDPADQRCHNLTDAIFLPGLVPLSKQTAPTTDMVLRNGQAALALQKTGTVSISNAQNELIDLLCQLLDVLKDVKIVGSLGPGTFSVLDVASLTKLSLQFKSFKKGP